MLTSRRWLEASMLAAASLVACEGETKTVVASTQLLVSVEMAEALRGRVDRLRATVWTRAASTWEEGSTVTLQTEALRWPVDLPILPSRAEHESAQVELVLEALSGSTVVAETRVLSRFVPKQRLTLRATLSPCAGREPGFVCAAAGCHGDACTVCTPTGQCVPVQETPGELWSLDGGTITEAPEAPDGQFHRDAGTHEPTRDGATTSTHEAGASAPRDAGAHLGQPPDAGSADAGSARICPVDHACKDPYPCVPTALGYTCLGQMADWPMPDGFDFAKFKHRYTSDGTTVVDDVTRLEWQTNVPLVHEGCTRFSLSKSGTNPTVMGPVGEWCTLPEARQHCADLVFAGKDDWRLPSMIELSSLLDHSRSTSRYAIDTMYFPDIEWSSYVTTSPYATPSISSRSVDMVQRSTWAESEGEVRCVRGISEPPFATPADRYSVDVVADTVTDRATQLVWQRTASATALVVSAPELTTYCQAPFRLPTPNELLTLVDPTRENPAIDIVAFPNTPSAKFWTVANDRGRAVSFANGDMGIYAKGDAGDAGYVRCVR